MGFYGKPTITDTTYVVTAPGGAGAGYYIDGVQRATVELQVGYTYRFDTSDSSNSSHPFRFATSSDGTTYSTGVTVGSGYVDIVVTSSTPSTLYYKCTAHGGMGGQINVVDNSEYKAFISASGGFLFKADDNNLISFGQSVSGGDGSSTKSFVLKSDNVFLSGSNVNILGERFFLGGGSQFVSGSNGNIEISSSNFHLTSEGNVTMSGEITAAGGTIGGFTIGDDLDSTSGTLKLKGALGQITASAVSMSGAITATSGLIGGMKIESNSIESTADAGDGTTTTYTVTVNGSQKYVIDGVAQDSLTFIPGNTYRFDQADDSNENHPLRFVQTSGGTDYYTTGVTTNGSPGSGGAYTQIAVTQATPTQLYYRCTAHSGMGGSITVDKTSPLILDGNSGQITGSRVLFDGGTIGGFELASTQINSTNDNLILKSNGQITASAAKISGAITITSGASFDSLSSLNQATASLESSVTSLGQATASLQSATGSLQTNITNIGVGATASASAAQSNAQSYASGVGTGAAASASAAQSNAESYAVGVGAGATTSASAAQTNAQNYAVGIGEGAAASSSAVQTNLNTVSSSTAERIMTDVSGSILDITPSPSGEGLYLNYPHMGFYDNSEFTAFISASGGFLFKADDNNLISFGQSVSGGDGSSTKSFVLKSDNVFLSGSNVNILGERFFLGGESQFVSGSNGNIEISSSKFHVQPDGDVVMNNITASNASLSGKVTATSGEIGGFTIGTSKLESIGISGAFATSASINLESITNPGITLKRAKTGSGENDITEASMRRDQFVANFASGSNDSAQIQMRAGTTTTLISKAETDGFIGQFALANQPARGRAQLSLSTDTIDLNEEIDGVWSVGDISPDSSVIIASVNGLVTHGDRLRIRFVKGDCDTGNILTTVYTYHDNPKLVDLKDQLVDGIFMGENVVLKILFTVPLFSNQLAYVDMGWVQKDALKRILLTQKKIDLNLEETSS